MILRAFFSKGGIMEDINKEIIQAEAEENTLPSEQEDDTIELTEVWVQYPDKMVKKKIGPNWKIVG